MNIERALLQMMRQQAIGRLFEDDRGGTFTTEDYAKSVAIVCRKNARGKYPFPPPPPEIARWQLSDCETVIPIGPDLWMTTDSREH